MEPGGNIPMGLNDAIRKVTLDPDSWRLLRRIPIDYDDRDPWMTGGCGILAEAIKMIVPEAEYWAVVDNTGQTYHMFVKIGPYYYDESGMTISLADMVYKCSMRGRHDPEIRAVRLSRWPEDVYRSPKTSHKIADMIMKSVGIKDW